MATDKLYKTIRIRQLHSDSEDDLNPRREVFFPILLEIIGHFLTLEHRLDMVDTNIGVIPVEYTERKYVLGVVFASWPQRKTKRFAQEIRDMFIRAQQSEYKSLGQWVEILVLETDSPRSYDDGRSLAQHIKSVGMHAVDVVIPYQETENMIHLFGAYCEGTGCEFLEVSRSFHPKRVFRQRVDLLEGSINALDRKVTRLVAGLESRIEELSARVSATPFTYEFHHKGRLYTRGGPGAKSLVAGDKYELRIRTQEQPSGEYDQPDYFTPEHPKFVKSDSYWVVNVTPKREFKTMQFRRHNSLDLRFGNSTTPWPIYIVVRREWLAVVLGLTTSILTAFSIYGFYVQWPLPWLWIFIALIAIGCITVVKWLTG